MSTQPTTSAVLRRVATRAGVGIWRQRGGVLIALALTAAGLAYMSFGASLLPARVAAGATGATDCADTAMAAVADKSPSAAQRAYQCMDPSFQQRVPEAQFVRQMQQQALPNVQKLQRVADYHPTAGGTMVYYAVDGGQQSVGYIVYLGDNGKVLHIE